MYSCDNSPSTFRSVFERTFDCIVYGAGLIGFAAARRLASSGQRVMLVEASGDLLWESTRALENSIASAQPAAAWEAWLEPLRQRGCVDANWFDPALAEMLTANQLQGSDAPFQTLLYASPVTIERVGEQLTHVTVATKAGLRSLQAGAWIDASEEGVLARLCAPDLCPRAPLHTFRSLILQSRNPEAIDTHLAPLTARHPGLECFGSQRPGERRLRWREEADAWYHKSQAIICDLRQLLGDDASANLCVSHCGMRPFPVYAAQTEPQPALPLPANLRVLSPTLTPLKIQSPADRFSIGDAVSSVKSASPEEPPAIPATVTVPARELGENYDVVVAGVGTAGALAAIAAGRNGARTLAFDHTTYPGGVGTGGGITGYFHGLSGGLQDEVDQRVAEISTLFSGRALGTKFWHHEAKKIALLEMFESAHVVFHGEALLGAVERDADGWVNAVDVVIEGQWTRIRGSSFIDGTGDGDLCALAGAAFVTGREGDGRTLAFSQSAFYLTEDTQGLKVTGCNFDAGWVDPTNPEDITRARLEGIAQHLDAEGLSENRCLSISPLIGLRQSRQIESDHDLSFAEMVEGARFDDAIGVTKAVADTHSVDFEFESDTLAFYYWTCRGFRNILRCDLPYGMLLPRKLQNVWTPCRAAGIEIAAAYGLRMQRDMQRLGEAAGVAAALAATAHTGSRKVDLVALQGILKQSGALDATSAEPPASPDLAPWLEALDSGRPGVHLWHLSRHPSSCREAVCARLLSECSNTSFYAAAILAQWQEERAEPRLLRALQERETGPDIESLRVPGAHGQCIDLPFWLQAVVLLRQAGSQHCLPALHELASQNAMPFSVRTITALTLERLAARLSSHPVLLQILELLESSSCHSVLPPSFSVWRELNGEPQKNLANGWRIPPQQDHRWQLDLILERIRRRLGLPHPTDVSLEHARDPRAFVRQAFSHP